MEWVDFPPLISSALQLVPRTSLKNRLFGNAPNSLPGFGVPSQQSPAPPTKMHDTMVDRIDIEKNSKEKNSSSDQYLQPADF